MWRLQPEARLSQLGGVRHRWCLALRFSSPTSDDYFSSQTPAGQPGTINYPQKKLQVSRQQRDHSLCLPQQSKTHCVCFFFSFARVRTILYGTLPAKST